MKRREPFRVRGPPPWSPFLDTTDERCERAGVRRVENSRYVVLVRPIGGGAPALWREAEGEPAGGGCAPRGFWLSIRTRDRAPVHDWRDLQRVKDEIVGPEAEGVELYPAESRLVDASNQYHLWVFEPPFRFPFGYVDRLVTEEPLFGSVQRPFAPEHRPADLETREQVEARYAASGKKPD